MKNPQPASIFLYKFQPITDIGAYIDYKLPTRLIKTEYI